jgi:integrase/recombinase XerD
MSAMDTASWGAPALMVRWIDTRQAARSRQNAIYDLRAWLGWCRSQGLDWMAADADDIMRRGAELRAAGLSPRTVAGLYATVCGLYHWLWEAGHRADDASARVKRPRAPRSSGRVWLGRDDLRRLLDHVRAGDPTTSAATHLWGLSGPRTGETLRLDVADLSRHGGRMSVVIRRSKGRDVERIALPAVTAAEIERALGGRTSGPLLLSHVGSRLQPGIALGRLARACRDAGVPVVTPQGLRVGAITLALEAGIPERLVGLSVGHDSTAQTAQYDRQRAMVERNAGVQLADCAAAPVDVAPRRAA